MAGVPKWSAEWAAIEQQWLFLYGLRSVLFSSPDCFGTLVQYNTIRYSPYAWLGLVMSALASCYPEVGIETR
jgi:hypothetical protein